MNKIKVIVDASAPNYADVKKVLEDKGMEVIVQESRFDFDDEIINQINQLKAFESLYFKNPHSERFLKNNLSEDPYYQKFNKQKNKF